MSERVKTARERLEERLAKPIPLIPCIRDANGRPIRDRNGRPIMSPEQMKKHNREVLGLSPETGQGQGRKRLVEVDKVSAAVPMPVTAIEEALRRAVGEAARQRRLRALGDPFDHYPETIDDVVKRQDETR